MTKPTLLPCQHTFCFTCLQAHEQVRSGSLPLHCSSSLCSSTDNTLRTIVCPKCFHHHQIHSLSDLEENQSMELLINTLLCECCQQLSVSTELDTCLHCYGVFCRKCYSKHLDEHRVDSSDERLQSNQKSDSIENIFHPRSFDREDKVRSSPSLFLDDPTYGFQLKSSTPDEGDLPVLTKKKANSFLKKWIQGSRIRSSSPAEKSPSTKKRSFRRLKIPIDAFTEDTSTKDSSSETVPITPIRRFNKIFDQYNYADQHVKHCQKRQSELDRAVGKLLEVLTTKMNDNLDQISQHWKHLKQLSVDQLQSKSTRFQLWNSLWKTCCLTLDSRKQIESYIEQNDEIKAELQVLLSTLSIVNNKQFSVSLGELFDREETSTIRSFRRHLESLLSTYCEELTFITERIHFAESSFANWKNSDVEELDRIVSEWSQIIEHDYPSLIEKIANDYVTKLPQPEKILFQMLKNMKKRLLKMIAVPTVSQRTSPCW